MLPEHTSLQIAESERSVKAASASLSISQYTTNAMFLLADQKGPNCYADGKKGSENQYAA